MRSKLSGGFTLPPNGVRSTPSSNLAIITASRKVRHKTILKRQSGIAWRPMQDIRRLRNRLGVIYDHGKGMPRDEAAAASLFRLSAEQGYADAECNLGQAFYQGTGVKQDYVEASRWSRLAAEKGHARAQANLGGAYLTGHGVPQCDSEAAKWCRLAAEQGDIRGQTNLGILYFEGRGVPDEPGHALFQWRRRSPGSRRGGEVIPARCRKWIDRSTEFTRRYAPRWPGVAQDVDAVSHRCFR